MPDPRPTPSPSAGSAPKAPKPPTLPDYHGSAGAGGTAPTPSGGGATDIWGLGQLYGLPVFLGSQTSSPGSYTGGEPSQRRGGVGVRTNIVTGQTQDIMQQVIDLWSQQETERKQDPTALTGYEQLQQQLYAAGFYGQTAYNKIHVGQWTDQTQQALVTALGKYEQATNGGQAPVTLTEFLQNNAARNGDGGFYGGGSAGGAGGAGGGGAAPTLSVTDPEAIKSAVQSAAQEALGMGLNDQQLNTFVAKFQAAQTSAQTGTGTVTVPDLSSEAMSYAQSADPHAYKQNQRTAYLDQLVNLLGGGLTSRPDQHPVASTGGG